VAPPRGAHGSQRPGPYETFTPKTEPNDWPMPRVVGLEIYLAR